MTAPAHTSIQPPAAPSAPRARTREERAQSTVEFALVLPVMLTMIWMVFGFGLAFAKLLDLQSATREGARRGSIAYKDVHAVIAARGAVRNAIALSDPDDLTISVSPAPAPEWQHGQEITVSTSLPVSVNVIGFPVWNGTLRAEAETRVE